MVSGETTIQSVRYSQVEIWLTKFSLITRLAIPLTITTDRGTETGWLHAMQATLRCVVIIMSDGRWVGLTS